MSANNEYKKRQRTLKKFGLALFVTPYVRLKLCYQAYRYVYFTKYLNLVYSLSYFVENEVDQLICEPYINIANQFNKNDFIICYAMICRSLYERNRKGMFN